MSESSTNSRSVGRRGSRYLRPTLVQTWLLDGEVGVYPERTNLASAWLVEGDLDVERLRRALVLLSRRHPVGGFRVGEAGGRTVLEVRTRTSVPLAAVDLRRRPADEVDRFLSSWADTDFDLTVQPPVRLLLAQADRGFVLLVAAHHLFFDDVAEEVYGEDLWALYSQLETTASVAGMRGSPEAPPSLFDYADWEAELVRSESFRRRLAYWAERLGDAETTLPFAGRTEDPDRPAREEMPVEIGPEVGRSLVARARERGTSPVSLLLAALHAALLDTTGDADYVVQVVSHGRTPRFSRTVAHLANPLVVRLPPVERPLSAAHVTSTHETVLAAWQNYVPVQALADGVPWLARRSARGYRQSEVLVQHVARRPEPRTTVDTALGKTRYALRHRARGQARRYDGVALALSVVSAEDGWSGTLLHEPSVVSPRVAGELVASLASGLRTMAAEPLGVGPARRG